MDPHSEQIFKKKDLTQVMMLGAEEHWLLKSSAVTLDKQSRCIAQPRQRGFLHGLTEVWVKSVAQDCSIDNLLVELRILRCVRHVNIVAFYGSTWDGDNSMLLVLEWIPGSNFEEYVKRRRNDGTFSDQVRLLTSRGVRCPIDERRLLVDIVRGMQYLHSQKPAIAHGGLKPSVVLVDDRRTPSFCKLSNFSKSVMIPPQLESTHEVSAAAGHIPLKADIFDFGLIALFAMTSEVPDPSSLDDHLQNACKLGEGEVGCLASIFPISESCLSDAYPNFTDVFSTLNQNLPSESLSQISAFDSEQGFPQDACCNRCCCPKRCWC